MKHARIIVKGKDCTNSITSIQMDARGMYEVYFKNNSKNYIYGGAQITFLPRRQIMDVSNSIVLIDGDAKHGVLSVEDYSSLYILKYTNGYEQSFRPNRVEIIGSCLDTRESKDKISYLKSIAYDVGLYREDGKNILGSYYEKLNFIREDTILARYLEGNVPDNYHLNTNQLIFPFGFNASQKQAVENAINNRLSVIQGPPGTGKTQTILNIIANLIRNRKTVAIVSNTNSATQNIYEKLKNNNLDFIAAQLGSFRNKQEFFKNQYSPEKDNLQAWLLDFNKEKKLYDQIKILEAEIDRILDSKNKLAELKSLLESILVESKYFQHYFDNITETAILPNFQKKVSSVRILDLWYKIEDKNGKLSVIDKIINFFLYRIKDRNFYKQKVTIIVATLQLSYYKAKIRELKGDINTIESFLLSQNIDYKTKQHTELSMIVFKSYIAKKYLKKTKKNYIEIDLLKNYKEFVSDYPVVLSTTYSLINSLSSQYIYDYVIIDEASQVDVATLVLALSCAKNAVIVGDHKQLPNVIDSVAKKHDDIIFERYNDIPISYKFSNHSALSTITETFGDSIPNQLLREHYRCDPKIIGFCNKMYYDNQLIILTPEKEYKDKNTLKVYKTVKGNHDREHVNQRQIDVTINEVIPELGLNINDDSVGIVTPYKKHAEELEKTFKDNKLLAATVDKFQGRERDVIIINTVDSQITNFASNPNRLNVAVSRAKNQLIVVTNGNDSSKVTGMDELVKYIEYHQGDVVDSKILSIFDNLYTSYYDRKVKKARYNSSPAEDLMLELLNKIYKDNNFGFLDTALEYPIRMMIDTRNLTGRAKQYVDNPSYKIARADFVIFRKTSKQPLLVIEVDGYVYHNNIKQKERDELKNQLLKDAGIPLERFSTIGSNEEERIVRRINELLSNS